MIKTIILSVASISTLAGCGTASTTSDIVPIGKDTFLVARPGGLLTFSGGEVKTQLYRDANDFCRSKGKYLMPVSSSSKDSGVATYANAELQFRCLSDKDEDYGRPTMQREADMTIQIRK